MEVLVFGGKLEGGEDTGGRTGPRLAIEVQLHGHNCLPVRGLRGVHPDESSRMGSPIVSLGFYYTEHGSSTDDSPTRTPGDYTLPYYGYSTTYSDTYE